MKRRIFCRRLGEFVTVTMDINHDRDIDAAHVSIASDDGGLMEGEVLGEQVSVAHHAILDGDLDLLSYMLPDEQPPSEMMIGTRVDNLIAELTALASAQIAAE